MAEETIDACISVIQQIRPEVVDITGGAPELHPAFRRLTQASVDAGSQVLDRCNLSVLLLAAHRDLPSWLAERGVEVVASLPHPRRSRTDAQRGELAFERSIRAMRALNDAGYGRGDPRRRLTLMHNPSGAFLPGGQASMEREWKEILHREQGVSFDRLIALNNMPISRFLEWLDETGNLASYLQTLVGAFNPAAVDGLMCRDTVSVGWDGTIFDCDFNQMLDLPAAMARPNVRSFDVADWMRREIVTRRHCFGCTAGSGSSCAGATA
jgi:radical SAM/Cys-rich protein